MLLKKNSNKNHHLQFFNFAHEITFIGLIAGIYQPSYFSNYIKFIWGIVIVIMFYFYIKKYLILKGSKASLALELFSILCVVIGLILALFIQNEGQIFAPYFWLFVIGILLKKGSPMNTWLLNKTKFDRNSVILYVAMLILSIYASIKAFIG